MVASFVAAVDARATEVADLGAAVPERYRVAAEAAVAQIGAAVQERTQAAAAHLAQLRAEAEARTASARATVAAQHAAARAAISSSTATAREQLEGEYTNALQAIEGREREQLPVIDQRYQAGIQGFREAGRVVGEEAVQRGNQMAAEYMRGLVDRDDSFLDGPLTFNRGKACADTAREISKAYQSGLAGEADKQADQAQQGRAKDVELVHTTAGQAWQSLQQQHTAVLATIVQAETTALQQADSARDSLTASIAQALAGSLQTLDQMEVSLSGNLAAAARAQAADVEQQASQLAAATQDRVSEMVVSARNVSATVAAEAQGAEGATARCAHRQAERGDRAAGHRRRDDQEPARAGPGEETTPGGGSTTQQGQETTPGAGGKQVPAEESTGGAQSGSREQGQEEQTGEAGKGSQQTPAEEPLTPDRIRALSDEETMAEIAKRVPDPETRAKLLEGIDRPKTLLKYLARGSTPESIEAGLAEVTRTGVPQGLTEDQFAQMSRRPARGGRQVRRRHSRPGESRRRGRCRGQRHRHRHPCRCGAVRRHHQGSLRNPQPRLQQGEDDAGCHREWQDPARRTRG
jgi:hypothetical protein